MGNTPSLTRTAGALDSYVSEIGGDIVYERSLGSARFLKTVKCLHRNGYIVVKIFIKSDPGLSLRNYHRRLKMDREALLDLPNVYSYQAFVETDKAGYIVRQWIASNLYDRISTRPFLSSIEKKWISFQILNALRDARNRKVSHGDIKSENILVTSWNWVYVSDFASYKPTYLPLDDPSDFSFFFDTSGRRTCYIAPERFYTAQENPEISARKTRLAMSIDDGEGKRDGKVTEAMDCFSVGCVIAELFLEGAPLFTLSQLFKYREGESTVDAALTVIEDDGVRNLIKQMIALDPASRPSFDMLLHTSRGSVFPECFYSFLHNYVASVSELPTPSPFASPTPLPSGTSSTAPSSALRGLPSAASAPGGALPDELGGALPSDSDQRMERIWADYESTEPYIIADVLEDTLSAVKIEYTVSAGPTKPFQDVFPVELHVPNRESALILPTASGQVAAAEDGPALIILALVSTNVRNCRLPSSKIRALDVFLALCPHLTDEAKIDRMVPYIVDLLHDEAAIVRSSALRTLMQVVMLVTVITPFNASIFPEYIIPNISHLIRDPEVSVRCMYAQCIVPLGETALRYLEMGQALKAHGAFKRTTDVQEYEEAHLELSYEASMQDLQSSIQEHLSALLMDSSSVVKRAVLHNISSICIFLGRQKTNDVLLSHMITYLNDRDWLLRYAFFDSIVDVAACAGGRSLDEYILPLMIQALSGAAAFIASAAKHLPSSDMWCILYPSLRHFIRSDIRALDERSLLEVVKTPLPRSVYDAALQWAMKADKSSFWRNPRRLAPRSESPRDSMIATRKGLATSTRAKSEEDETQLAKLRQLGMSSGDEAKLLAMRDYISKLADAVSSFASRLRLELQPETLQTTSYVELQKLGVTPQTVFLKARADQTLRSPRSAAARSAVFDQVMRTPVPGTPHLSRPPSVDHGGSNFEDLRRRLATINGSSSSLHPDPASARDSRASMSPVPANVGHTTTLAADMELPPLERPASPAESVLSANTSAFRGMHRLSGGVMDGHKAAPAIGSSRANAVGLLDTAMRLRSEASPERSGRSSPASVAGTIRGQIRQGPPSVLLPISTYGTYGQEPGISNLLEHMYLDNNRDMQDDFGPRVHVGPVRRRTAVRHSFMPRDGSSRRTEAMLITHLHSHSDAITSLAVSPDHLFFVSASDDKTVKIWDTARLERNITAKPRQTYGQHHARVKAVCMLEGLHCFASAADDGSLHIVRVHVSQSGALPKYNKMQVIREHRVAESGEYITSLVHYQADASSNLLYATTHARVVLLDLRNMRVLQAMENPRHYGPITSLCLDKKRSWLIVATATGVLSLWDLRFGLLLKNWRVGQEDSETRIHACHLHPSKGRGKWVMVALEAGALSDEEPSRIIVEVWDVEKMALVETYNTKLASAPFHAPVAAIRPNVDHDAETNPAAAIATLVRSRQQQHMPGSFTAFSQLGRTISRAEDTKPSIPVNIRAMVVGLEFGGHSSHKAEAMDLVVEGSPGTLPVPRGFMLTGSEDHRIRLWDLGRIGRSTVLSGLDDEGDKPAYSETIEADGRRTTYAETWPSLGGGQTHRPPQRISLINQGQQNLLKSHQDTVSALACIDSPFRGGIVSGDRLGVIKVWRVDGAD
ncbi:hypothetical protein PUNSTDRAFT_96429 [Punctularia strigosozonata HHB-11173 SS5]|uniref:uncharacterized protein n=1 Tax=Punctularia strigosozonata (strain HHB-11173) TaxID=741275 RepID=UPI000441873E|nr:uncharacterized protein PUNSTDRAFT_96429 [Punctularia strigosozonata HHB-11173 SS5]EIN14505.1 hypothetical protein PUNSTDRAFT_96429 [Punctularia strigosozonata HHB-11173 SS5]